jgi:hypothetical protein
VALQIGHTATLSLALRKKKGGELKSVIIESSDISLPFVEPARHFCFMERGITDEGCGALLPAALGPVSVVIVKYLFATG